MTDAEIIATLKEAKHGISSGAESIDGEWGSGRTIEMMRAAGEFPILDRIEKAIAELESRNK